MLLAIKLLVALSVLSYAVAMVLTTSDSTAFQPPISHFLGRTSGKNEDYLTLKTCRTSSAIYSKKEVLEKSLRHRQVYPEVIDRRPITTVDGLRVKHGQATWWGDLNHIETRYVYHQLLPRQLLEDAQARKQDLCVEDLARAACMARHAARIYARERSSLPLRLLAGLYDGFRHLQSFGRWSWTGMTYEEVWAKYDRKIREELGEDNVDERELNRMISLRILQKACQTNPHFDKFAEIERAHEILSRAAAWDRSLPSSSSSAAAMGGHLRPLFEYMNKVAQSSQVAGA